jgi:nitroimidazol reductase NimA-like FMN-containing flavoprotein (pyridoxamine 5'-phosphate oxidase superfamily)
MMIILIMRFFSLTIKYPLTRTVFERLRTTVHSGDLMTIVKMPTMEKSEYDRLIEEEHICRIAFRGDDHPHIAPFLYVFDGRYMYFLSTRYGKKVRYFKEHPSVLVEVERYSADLSSFCFVTLPGRLVEVTDPKTKMEVRRRFVDLITSKRLSENVLSALGHSPEDGPGALIETDRTSVWKLVGVRKITGLKGHTTP